MAQPLKVRVRNNVKDQVALNMNEPIDGIVDDFLFVQGNTVTASHYTAVKLQVFVNRHNGSHTIFAATRHNRGNS
jgi:hypothetical protein